MSLRSSVFLIPLPPPCHTLSSFGSTSPPHVALQKVIISDDENVTKNILICVHRMIIYSQKGLIKRKSCPRMHEFSYNYVSILCQFSFSKTFAILFGVRRHFLAHPLPTMLHLVRFLAYPLCSIVKYFSNMYFKRDMLFS